MFLIPFFTWYGFRQALATDRLIGRLEEDPKLAKTHHRKIEPYREGWDQKVYVWPHLLKVELLATIIVTVILMVWAIGLNTPLEEPANPNLTMNPAKAPWYFLGLQEMLVYFDPWIAGVVMPTLIIIGLIAIPYIDTNPLGNGYYTFRQRRFAILAFCFGFIVLWVSMVIIGTFIRGPGWMWFWPGETWDHHRPEPTWLGPPLCWGMKVPSHWGELRPTTTFASHSWEDRSLTPTLCCAPISGTASRFRC